MHCESCGAPIQNNEAACSYCTSPRPQGENLDRIEVTCYEDKRRRYINTQTGLIEEGEPL